MIRRPFTAASVVSLLLCVATCALWVRGRFVGNVFVQTSYDGKAVQRRLAISSRLGRVAMMSKETRYTGLDQGDIDDPGTTFFSDPPGWHWHQVRRSREGGARPGLVLHTGPLRRMGFEAGRSQVGRVLPGMPGAAVVSTTFRAGVPLVPNLAGRGRYEKVLGRVRGDGAIC